MDKNENRYVASLENRIEQLENELQTYQLLLAMQLSDPGWFCQTYPVVNDDSYQGA